MHGLMCCLQLRSVWLEMTLNANVCPTLVRSCLLTFTVDTFRKGTATKLHHHASEIGQSASAGTTFHRYKQSVVVHQQESEGYHMRYKVHVPKQSNENSRVMPSL